MHRASWVQITFQINLIVNVKLQNMFCGLRKISPATWLFICMRVITKLSNSNSRTSWELADTWPKKDRKGKVERFHPHGVYEDVGGWQHKQGWQDTIWHRLLPDGPDSMNPMAIVNLPKLVSAALHQFLVCLFRSPFGTVTTPATLPGVKFIKLTSQLFFVLCVNDNGHFIIQLVERSLIEGLSFPSFPSDSEEERIPHSGLGFSSVGFLSSHTQKPNLIGPPPFCGA